MIHPHATGTPGSTGDPGSPGSSDHDAAELDVYHRALGPAGLAHGTPDFYASKGALGHGLGAAGLVSLVIACLCAKARLRPPMPWLHQPIESALPVHRDSRNAATTHAIFAAGFGGHVAGAVIARV